MFCVLRCPCEHVCRSGNLLGAPGLRLGPAGILFMNVNKPFNNSMRLQIPKQSYIVNYVLKYVLKRVGIFRGKWPYIDLLHYLLICCLSNVSYSILFLGCTGGSCPSVTVFIHIKRKSRVSEIVLDIIVLRLARRWNNIRVLVISCRPRTVVTDLPTACPRQSSACMPPLPNRLFGISATSLGYTPGLCPLLRARACMDGFAPIACLAWSGCLACLVCLGSLACVSYLPCLACLVCWAGLASSACLACLACSA